MTCLRAEISFTGEEDCLGVTGAHLTTRVIEICVLLGYYAASNGNPLPTFRGNVSVPSSRVKKSLKMGPIRCPETSVNDYHSTLSNTPEERRFHQHRGGSQ